MVKMRIFSKKISQNIVSPNSPFAPLRSLRSLLVRALSCSNEGNRCSVKFLVDFTQCPLHLNARLTEANVPFTIIPFPAIWYCFYALLWVWKKDTFVFEKLKQAKTKQRRIDHIRIKNKILRRWYFTKFPGVRPEFQAWARQKLIIHFRSEL